MITLISVVVISITAHDSNPQTGWRAAGVPSKTLCDAQVRYVNTDNAIYVVNGTIDLVRVGMCGGCLRCFTLQAMMVQMSFNAIQSVN